MKRTSFDTEEKALFIVICICLLFLLGLTLTGCVTKKETYLIILEPDQAQTSPVCDKETIYVNRFEKQFYKADSTFMDNLRKASKEARETANKRVYLK